MLTIILAGGSSTGFNSRVSASLHNICTAPMFMHVVNAAHNIQGRLVVVGNSGNIDAMRECTHSGINYVVQEKQLGTAHAVQLCMPHMDGASNVIILSANIPLVRADTIQNAYAKHMQEGNDLTILAKTEHANRRDIAFRGAIICRVPALLASLGCVSVHNAAGELMLSECIELMRTMRNKIGYYSVADESELIQVRTKLDLMNASRIMRERINNLHMIAGVTMYDPDSVFIEGNVSFGKDVTLLPGCILRGAVKIGSGTTIGSNVEITDSVIGEDCHISNAVILSSTVGNKVSVGPFAYIRPGSVIGDNVKIGDFVEVKNSVVGDGSKVPHLAYVGDTDMGKKVNFGCGAITANYNGIAKSRTIIKDGAFVGSNSNLVAPVVVGENSFTAAGSTITDDVPSEALAIARNKQSVKENWVTDRKK